MNVKKIMILGAFISVLFYLSGKGSVQDIDQVIETSITTELEEMKKAKASENIEVKELDYTINDYYRTTTVNDQLVNYLQVEEKKIPVEIKQLTMNYYKDVTIEPVYLVIHETNNYNRGADANAHYRYWSTNPTANASTHFVVDDKEIYQMLELNQAAWHVGDNRNYSDITNYNSIGIEIAVNSDGDYGQARQNTIELTINVMKMLDLNITQLKRHYDASGKYCPTKMLDEPDLWTDFVEQVALGLIK